MGCTPLEQSMSEDRHPQTILVAEEFATANALAEWLTEKGFPAEVVRPSAAATPGDSLGLSPETGAGIEVRLMSLEHMEPAKQAIAEQKEAIAEIRSREEKRAARTGTVEAVCEDCGKSSTWAASEMGTTQDCPHCHNYMDIPDPEENWDEADFEGAEEEEERE
jgi:hypothetical protein